MAATSHRATAEPRPTESAVVMGGERGAVAADLFDRGQVETDSPPLSPAATSTGPQIANCTAVIGSPPESSPSFTIEGGGAPR